MARTTRTLQEKLDAGEPTLGTMIQEPDMVELAAHMGFDWFIIDQMFTGNDWSRTEYLVRTGEAAGIEPFVRVQANPWLGENPNLAIEVGRALGIGARNVMVSHSTVAEIAQCAPLTRDWHRKVMHIHPYDSLAEWQAGDIVHKQGDTFVIPHAESLGALETVEETMMLPDVHRYFFAMSDASRQLAGEGETPNFYDERLWKIVDDAVETGKRENVIVGANISYAYDMDELLSRTQLLGDRGIKLIMLQTAPFLFQVGIGKFLKEAKRAVGL